MNLFVLKSNGEKYSINVSSSIFDLEYNSNFLHQFITSYISNGHVGQKSQKSRAAVSGSGKKPWRQKGSGRARVGSIRSPLWRGGGKIFAHNSNLNRYKKINKRMFNFGMRMIFSQLLRENRLFVFEDLLLTNISTKSFLCKIDFLKIKSSSLLVFDEVCTEIHFSSRNLKELFVTSYNYITPFILMKFNNIFFNVNVINLIEESFNEKN